MNRLNLLFFLCLFGVFLLLEYAGENLWADDSVMQRVRSITDECLTNMKKIKRGELTLNFNTTNEEQPSLSARKTLNIVFDNDKMMVVHTNDRTATYAFNCYQTERNCMEKKKSNIFDRNV
ncbi:MAG: hypothetical protein LBU65_12700 [Planctomycetaceae bacterium]|jgi:hypothetical protein|nr:hypothetical protein [Planctomycetaceae bacterium]